MVQNHPLRQYVVLNVDDDADTLRAQADLIADTFGCRVLSVSSCDQALRLIDSGLRVDIVFSDVVMPGMDGLTLAEQLRRRLPDLPVVLTTGRSDVVDSLVERGGVALLKPYSIERLEAVLREQVRADSRDPPSDPPASNPDRASAARSDD